METDLFGINTKNNLLDLEIKLKEIIKEKAKCMKKFDYDMHKINRDLDDTSYSKYLLLNALEHDKIINAKKFIYTKGIKEHFYDQTKKMIDEVIKDITEDFKILKMNFYGSKDFDKLNGQGFITSYHNQPYYENAVLIIGLQEKYRNDNCSEMAKEDICNILYFLNLLKDKNNHDKILLDNE